MSYYKDIVAEMFYEHYTDLSKEIQKTVDLIIRLNNLGIHPIDSAEYVKIPLKTRIAAIEFIRKSQDEIRGDYYE